MGGRGACDGQGALLGDTKVAALKRWDTSFATDLRPALAVMKDSHSGFRHQSVICIEKNPENFGMVRGSPKRVSIVV